MSGWSAERVRVNFQAGFQASASLSGGVLTRTSPSIEWGGFGADSPSMSGGVLTRTSPSIEWGGFGAGSPSMSGGVLDKVHWKSKRPHSIEGEGFVRCGRFAPVCRCDM
jgi:hypothetical protein